MQATPNKKESLLYSVLQNILPKEYQLNVKADIMILGGKIPDFVNVNGQKKVIELYGDYWHRGQNPQDKINFYKQFGWDCLVVWERELKDLEFVKKSILNFNKKEEI
jgi:G:T-mismatch repair DNA endonuclease (very short patch repair protein)